MPDSPSNDRTTKRRWIGFGETIGLAAVVISGLGLWNSWRNDEAEKPVTQVEARAPAIPIALRGKIEADGKTMIISPVEPGHSLESLTLTVAGKPPIPVGSDGRLAASDVERLVGEAGKSPERESITARIEARYIEAGTLKRGGGRYLISYRWDDGGLFGGEKLRLTGLSLG